MVISNLLLEFGIWMPSGLEFGPIKLKREAPSNDGLAPGQRNLAKVSSGPQQTVAERETQLEEVLQMKDQVAELQAQRPLLSSNGRSWNIRTSSFLMRQHRGFSKTLPGPLQNLLQKNSRCNNV
eukprot:symbB.v1.2.017719.t1/scaffold1384.1/size122353/9